MNKILTSCLVCSLVLTALPAQAAVDFENQILPIFEIHCISCHGAEKAQAKLDLHSVEGIKAKLEIDEHLIVAGDTEKSELYKRLTLPADDKRRMPKGADPLSKDELELIATWIKEGGAFSTVSSVTSPAPTEKVAEAEALKEESPKPEPLPLPEVPVAPQEAVDQLMAAGAQVMPLFSGSPLLEVSFALSPHPPTDESMKLLEKVSSQVINLNLKNAKATDEGWKVLSTLENLTNLNVQNSSFSDAAAENLSSLTRLESLNLYGTSVTDAALEPLKGLKRLRRLYLWQTEVTYDAAVALEKEIPGIEWNLGWDHPVIKRKRLETQKTEFAELVKKAEAETARLKGELQVAEEAQATAVKRLKEVEESLAKLNEAQSAEPAPTASQTN